MCVCVWSIYIEFDYIIIIRHVGCVCGCVMFKIYIHMSAVLWCGVAFLHKVTQYIYILYSLYLSYIDLYT